jgi:hypothetical protein
MNRVITAALIGLTTLALAGPALAFQCPKLIAQIDAATGTRFDAAAAEAKAKAAQAADLHKQGKHAESVQAAQEGLKILGM